MCVHDGGGLPEPRPHLLGLTVTSWAWNLLSPWGTPSVRPVGGWCADRGHPAVVTSRALDVVASAAALQAFGPTPHPAGILHRQAGPARVPVQCLRRPRPGPEAHRGCRDHGKARPEPRQAGR
ncbi:hypothetical protein HOK021_46930 [Streptomyces hygroscopicus]|nr:hypothetical protein HOK021_46930 [Streptomyces hygroscopicus]